ncbi:protein GVQW3 [Trichonephila clavipes]|uniref:Protein GVQW3 n=1 Tax=Trichonephila clavipes TaxID=2585209 RepID=A0A8X6VK60_TRICX|nr:protein GVQW3 [Trichonephila clavipes]
MTERTEQRICIKFCFNLGKSCAETIEMLQKAFKDEWMGKTQIKEWYGRFKNGRTSVDSDPRSGRPSTGTSSHNVERVRVAVEQDHRLTVRELEDEIRIPKMEVSVGATAEKSPSKSKQHQVNVDCFFYYEGIVHHKYAHTGQTINKEYYVEVLKRLRNAIRRKRPQLWESGDWLLHHDNAPAHTSNLVQQYLSKHSIAQLRQPPYSPDIAPCDFWLFPRLKMPLKGHRFDNKQTVETNATNALKVISKTDFQECFNKWKHRYEQLVQSNGDYFEGCHPPDDEE